MIGHKREKKIWRWRNQPPVFNDKLQFQKEMTKMETLQKKRGLQSFSRIDGMSLLLISLSAASQMGILVLCFSVLEAKPELGEYNVVTLFILTTLWKVWKERQRGKINKYISFI